MVRLVTDPAFVEEIRSTLPELPDAPQTFRRGLRRHGI